MGQASAVTDEVAVVVGVEFPGRRRVFVTGEEFVRGVNVSGVMGCGKTSFVRLLLHQLPRFWVMDYKDDYTYLPLVGGLEECVVLTIPGTMRLAALVPPAGCGLDSWVGRVVEVLARDSGLMTGSRNCLHHAVKDLLEHAEVRKLGVPPDLGHLAALLGTQRATGGPGRDYLERVKNRIDALLLETGDLFRCSTDPINQILDDRVVFRFDPGLSEETRLTITNLLLAKKLHARMARGERGGVLRSVTVIDEAHRWCDATFERLAGGRTTASQLLLDMREYGEGVVTVCQNLDQFSHQVLANAACKVVFRQGDRRDTAHIRGPLGLSWEDEQQVLTLANGTAVIRPAQTGVPVCMQVPYVPPLPVDLPTVEALGRVQVFPTGLPAPAPRIDFALRPPPPKPPAPHAQSAGMDDRAERFLRVAAADPVLLVHEIAERAKLSGAQLERTLRALQGRPELVRFVQVQTGRRGRQPSWPIVQPEAYRAQGVPAVVLRGKGGDEHRFWQNRVARTLRADPAYAKVMIEYVVNGKAVDVWAVRADGTREAYEVQLRQEHALDNLAENERSANPDVHVLLVNTETARHHLLRKLEASGSLDATVQVRLLSDFLNIPKRR